MVQLQTCGLLGDVMMLGIRRCDGEDSNANKAQNESIKTKQE